MEIRQLSATDAATYRELRLFGLRESPAAFGATYNEMAARPLEVFAERLTDPQNHIFGAYDETGQLVGVITLRWEQRERTRHKATVFGVYVKPDYRRLGAGRALLEAALARADELGVRQVNLGVNNDLTAAVRLYEACGFEQYGLEKEAFKVGERFYDAAYMVYRLPENS